AARKAGFEKVLVPKWSILKIEGELHDDNATIVYADELKVSGIDVVTVSTIDEALSEFTGTAYEPDLSDIDIPKEYQELMSKVATRLCERTNTIYENVQADIARSDNETLDTVLDNMKKARMSME